jgi:hypothetical protein
VQIHQDVDLYASLLSPGAQIEHPLAAGRHAWLQVARGSVTANGLDLGSGDGAAISDEAALRVTAGEAAELLVFDLA